jgi:uncharacterized iron-regulated protein
MKILFSCLFFLFSFFPAYVSEAAERFPAYTLSVSFDLPSGTLHGVAEIVFPEGREAVISTDMLEIISVKQDGQVVEPEIYEGMFTVRGTGILEIAYKAVYAGKTGQEEGILENNVSAKGISLIRAWYPALSTMAFYRLKAMLPEGYTALSGADEVEVLRLPEGTEYSFLFPYPVRQIQLIGTVYDEMKEVSDGVEIYGYFSPANNVLGKRLMKQAKADLATYGKVLRRYPFKRYTIAEHFLPGEYSMPSCMITGTDLEEISSSVVKFRRNILKQWFGNFIYADPLKGNWIEGLTAYLSEYYPEEKDADRWQSRKNIMIGYENSVFSENETSLRDFRGGTGPSSIAIGSGKGSMFFHMLKNLLGEEIFLEGLRMFVLESSLREVSWDDVRAAFEISSGRELEGFFGQWTARKGLPLISMEQPGVKYKNGVPTVSFGIIQVGEPYELTLSGLIRTSKGDYPQTFNISKRRETFQVPVEGTPLELILDPRYDVMRRLSEDELPPVLSALFGDQEKIVVLRREEREKYVDLLAFLEQKGFRIVEDADMMDEDIERSSLLVLGFDTRVIRRLFGNWTENIPPGVAIVTRKNPLNKKKIVAVAYADNQENIVPVIRKIFMYGNYSMVRIREQERIETSIYEADKGQTLSLREQIVVVEPHHTNELEDVIDRVIDFPVIYVGERHTNYEDHKVQLQVIMRLHDQGGRFAIGMEMFQKPFQRFIDEYLAGTITEREFLKKTEYFKRWQFDYSYYREILEYAKVNNIPVVALNLWTEIIRKVASNGLDGLTEIEKDEIPKDMDMSDETYRERLMEVFQHHNRQSKDFNYFYQSQILWDETMAHTVDEYLQKNPGYQFVVLAGVGHVMYGSGIPRRLKRLNGKDYVTLVPHIGSLDKDLGDFVYLAEEIPSPPALKLGVVLKEISGRVRVEKVIPRSIAQDLGIQKGDIIVALDDWNIEEINDVKIFMSGSTRGQETRVKILRKKFLVGYEQKVLSGTF